MSASGVALGQLILAAGAGALMWIARRTSRAHQRPTHSVVEREVIVRVPVEVVREVQLPGTIEYRSLPEDLSSYQTLPEIMLRLGVARHKALTWSLGRQAARLHLQHYGVPPRKVSRQKTSGSGTHDFAGYPPDFIAAIEALILPDRRQNDATNRAVSPPAARGRDSDASVQNDGVGRA